MRIAVVNQHRSDVVGGSELQCDLVARGLAARGHDVHYVAVTSGGTDRPAPRGPYAFIRVGREASAIVEACARLGAEIVYWRMNRLALPPVVDGLRERGIPLVFAIADSDDTHPYRHSPWPRSGSARDLLHEVRVRIAHRRSWSAVRSVAGIASQRADFLGRVPGVEQRVVRNLMADDEVPFAWPRPYVAWAGRLQQRKRPELIVPIADALAPYGVDVLVAGQVREERYRDLVGPPTARPNLYHLGVLPQAEVIGLLHGARAFAMTAHEEGFANVLIQSWWNGTPTVSFEYDPDDLIATNRLGSVCGGDVDTMLARIVEFVTEDDAAANRRRERIRASARVTFAADATLDALEGLLEDVRH